VVPRHQRHGVDDHGRRHGAARPERHAGFDVHADGREERRQGATPVERYFSVEEYEQDIDSSLYGTDMKVVKMDFNAQPNRNIEVTFTFMGLDAQSADRRERAVVHRPTYTTSLPLVMVDGTIRINGVDYTVLTGFQFSLDLGGQTTADAVADDVVDVFLANAKLTGSFTAIRQDLTFWTAFSAETQVEFFVHCAENESRSEGLHLVLHRQRRAVRQLDGIASDGPMIAHALGRPERTKRAPITPPR
jgi:hypothetical protein